MVATEDPSWLVKWS